MKKFVYKFLAVVVSFVTAIAMIPLSNGSVAYAETAQVTSNVKYFSTTMYNFDKTKFNTATDTAIGIDKITGYSEKKQARQDGFYFIDNNNEIWAAGQVNKCNSGHGNNNVLVQGIVKNTLDSNGNIKFNYPNAGVFASPETNINGRDVYQNVQFPFVYDSTTGYYEFNSDKNHVHSRKSDGETLNLYSGSQTINNQGTFFPFNNDDDASPDYHFGMNMSVPFYMSESGKDQNNNDMKFEFSGDDDVWVFINGKLVLDIGGIHAAIGGSIDFATGEVKYTFGSGGKVYAAQGKDGKQEKIQDKTYNLYSNFGITREELASGENNLQIFYLERGAGKSNCKIKFNLPQKDTLEVSKTLGATTPYTNSDFQFQLLKKNNNVYEPVTNKEYVLYNGSSLVTGDYATNAEGKFTLKAGQHANFTENATGDYKVVELTGGYDTEWTLTKENNQIYGKVDGENAYTVPIVENTSGGVTKYVLSCVNSADVTLGDDTIVLDYGKPVQYDVRNNDSSQSKENASVYGIGNASLQQDATTADGYTGLDTDVVLDNGNIQINSQGIVTYTPTEYMSSVDKANYVVKYQVDNGKTNRYAYATVNVLPATSVYYEDDFGQINNDGNTVIQWTGTWDTATSNKTENNTYQGSSNSQYGWDSSYENDSKYSNGSAHVTTLDENNPSATATFTFTGTGVDVYTKTDATTGTVKATLYKVENGAEIAKKGLIIDNKSISSDNGYYQIPTLFFSNLEYGTYKVKITVTNAAGADKTTYYLDGIRVYNPLGVAPSDQIVQEAYKNAVEYNATFKTVRDILLDAQTFNADSVNNGAVFIDEIDDKSGNPSGSSGITSSVATYDKIGPKNEVYLSSGQSIAFEVNSGYEKLFIGAKAPNGTAEMYVSNGNGTKKVTIKTASDMYYEINAKDSNGKKYVVIENNGSNILAITKIRATGTNYTMNVQSSTNLVKYASTFSELKVSDTDSSGMVISEDKGDVDIDNSGDKDNNEDQDNNTSKPSSIWNQIISGLKKWFGR